MAEVTRRLDALYCTRETAASRVKDIVAEVESRAEAARQEVSVAITERIQALQERQKELISSIEKVARQKAAALQAQKKAIETGACRPAPIMHPDHDPTPDPSQFLLCADSIINFKIGEGDFLEKIPEFGSITESSTYSCLSYVRGPALGVLKVGNPTHAYVFSCDKDGTRRKEGGDNVVAELSTPEAFDSLEVTDLKDGRYKVSFVPRQIGNFTLRILAGNQGEPGEDVRDGPFPLTVQDPTEYKLIGAEDQEAKPRIGEQMDPSGTFGNLGHPSGCDFDHTGRFLFVADQANHRIQIFDTGDGHTPVHTFGNKGLGRINFDSPCDLVVDHENRVVVSDLLNHRLQVFQFVARTQSLNHVRSVENSFHFPKGLGTTDHGQLLVCDSGNHRVQIFNMIDDFSFVREFGTHGSGKGQFVTPLDVAVNRAGEIVVADACDRIQVFNEQGEFLRQIGGKGRRDGLFNYPCSITIDDEDQLYVCDQGNNRIQVLKCSDGTFLHQWGGKKKKPAGDGEEEAAPADDEAEKPDAPPPQPKMVKPWGIAVNSRGLACVSDYDSHVLFTF